MTTDEIIEIAGNLVHDYGIDFQPWELNKILAEAIVQNADVDGAPDGNRELLLEEAQQIIADGGVE